MNILKSLKREANTPGVINFKEQLENALSNAPSAPLSRADLATLAELISNRQLTVIEAMRVMKDHIKQGCGYEAPHRVKAIQVLEYLSSQPALAVGVMEQMSTTKWRQRLKQVAVESYIPPLQDAVVQLVYRWATQYRVHDWGIGMQQLLFELEEEGIIVQGAWKLDGARPQVIAMLGSPRSSGFPPALSDPHAVSPTRTTTTRSDPVPPSNRHPYNQDKLLEQAEGMAGDAIALMTECETLEQAAAVSDAGSSSAGNTAASSSSVNDTLRKGTDLAARCTLHLTHLQEALARASLSDSAMAQLCDIADALNNAQTLWETTRQQYRAQARPNHDTSMNPVAINPTPAPGPSQTSPSHPPAPLVDLLSFEDDEPLDAKRPTGNGAVPEAPESTSAAPVPDTNDPWASLTSVSHTPPTTTPEPTGSASVAMQGMATTSTGTPPAPAQMAGQGLFLGQGLQLVMAQGGTFQDQTSVGLPGTSSLPLSPSNPFAHPELVHATPPTTAAGVSPGVQHPQPGMGSALQGQATLEHGGLGSMGPSAQEVEGLRAALANMQTQLDSQAAQHVAAIAALRQQHEQHMAMVAQQEMANTARLQQRIAQLEAQLAVQQQQQPIAYGQQQPAVYSQGGASHAGPMPVQGGTSSGGNGKDWIAF